MRISTRGEYALRAILDLLEQGAGHVIKLDDIANRQNISINYLERIFGKLRKAGIVASLRGPAGGYNLSKDPDQIKVIDILTAAGDDPIARPKSEKSVTQEAKKASKLFDEVDQMTLKILSKTIDEL